jgi:hypothetical protein
MSNLIHKPPSPLRYKSKEIIQNLNRNVQDVYNALTDKDTFDRLLQQGLEGEYQQYNDQILEFFMNIKDRVSIEDLRVYEPIWTLKIEKGKCSICNEFANIHCVNCKDTIWLCVDDWRYHKADYHKLSA